MGDDQAPALRVGVVDASGRAVRVPGLGRWLARVAPRGTRGSVTIALVSDARIRALNRQYRGKDYATDVLSFPAAQAITAAGLSATGYRLPATADWLPAPAPRLQASGRTLRTPRTPRTLRTVRTAPRAPRAPGAPHLAHLAHDAHHAHPAHSDVSHLGDIVIARGVATRQARAQGHAPAIELKVLALHGLLHLLGYDHEIDNGRMRRVEARLRRQGGLPGGLIERGGVR